MPDSLKAKAPTAKVAKAKGLGGAAAQELIDLALKALANDEQAKKAKPAVDGAFELARQVLVADHKRTLSITGIRIGPKPDIGSKDDGSVIVVYNQSGPPVNARTRPKVVAYGSTHYTCTLIDMGPFGSFWLCITF